MPLAVLLVGVLTGGAVAAIGWYYAGVLRDDALRPDREPDPLDLVIEGVEGGRVVLRATDDADDDGDWQRPGRYLLEWEGGWAFAGEILARDGQRVTRELTVGGEPPPVGVAARLDGFAFPRDPLVAHGLPFRDVTVEGELGAMPAWLVPGERDTWVVFVHGKGADRREALRILPSLHAAGLPVLVITYRNDEGAPPGDSYYRYGETEWRDLEAAVAFARDGGARDVVLVGYSMGAGIAFAFLDRSPLAGDVSALIVDAPLLSFEASVDFEADERGLPGFLTWTGKRFTSWRFDLDWDALDYRDEALALDIPVLLFHGSEDGTNPVAESDAWAEARPATVTYVRVDGAEHVRAWNVDPEGYEAAVREFLARVASR